MGGEPGHAVADDEAAAVLPAEIPRRHVDQRGDAVAPAEQGDKMQREPGERAVDTRAPGSWTTADRYPIVAMMALSR